MFVGFNTASEDELETVNEEEEQQIFSGNPLLTFSLRAWEASASEHNLESDQHIKHFPVGWLYLAVVIDLWSRSVIGWSMSSRMTAQLACGALQMALWRRKRPENVIVHTDRGGQYCSADYQS